MDEERPQISRYPMPRAREFPFDPPSDLMRIQQRTPVTRVRIWDGSTPWLVTGYDNVRTLLSDPRASVDIDHPGYPHVGPGHAARHGLPVPFIDLDDPQHAAQRRAVATRFTPKQLKTLRPRIQQIVDDQVDELLQGPSPVDLVKAFALPVPSLVICELLGVPYADRAFFHGVARTFFDLDATPEQTVASIKALHSYLRDLARGKLANPANDLISHLAVEQLGTDRMTADEVAAIGHLMVLAGHESTANMIALGTALLLSEQEDLGAVGTLLDRSSVEAAVDELLRYLDILHVGRRRVALEDIEIGGVLIRAGEGLIAASDCANRDPSAFPDPDVLDLGRKASHHLTFGHGVHHCLGARLATLELQVVFGTLSRRIPTLALATPLEQVEFNHGAIAYGVRALPVRW